MKNYGIYFTSIVTLVQCQQVAVSSFVKCTTNKFPNRLMWLDLTKKFVLTWTILAIRNVSLPMFCLHPLHPARPLLAYSALKGKSSIVYNRNLSIYNNQKNKTLVGAHSKPIWRNSFWHSDIGWPVCVFGVVGVVLYRRCERTLSFLFRLSSRFLFYLFVFRGPAAITHPNKIETDDRIEQQWFYFVPTKYFTKFYYWIVSW